MVRLSRMRIVSQWSGLVFARSLHDGFARGERRPLGEASSKTALRYLARRTLRGLQPHSIQLWQHGHRSSAWLVILSRRCVVAKGFVLTEVVPKWPYLQRARSECLLCVVGTRYLAVECV